MKTLINFFLISILVLFSSIVIVAAIFIIAVAAVPFLIFAIADGIINKEKYEGVY